MTPIAPQNNIGLDELNAADVTEQYRQIELMYLKSYATWLSMREKAMLAGKIGMESVIVG